VGAVLALVDPALFGHADGVHDLRVAARSLRAALRILVRHPRSALVLETRASLRTAIRALADGRDRDVGRSLLIKLPSESAGEAAVKRRVLGLSDSDRRLALSRTLAGWPRNLDGRLVALLKRGESSMEVVIRRTRAEAWQQRRHSLDLIAALGRGYNPEQLHDLRKRVRRLRYAIEVLAEVDSAAHARVIQLKPLQSALGDAQDRIVLSRWLGRMATRFRRSDPVFSAALRRHCARYRTQSIAAHGTFLKLRPAFVLEKLALHVDAASEVEVSGKRVRNSPSVERERTRARTRAKA
jgi:CHAD domain-containing protein